MKSQMFLMHFAGGDANSYNFLTPYLSNFRLFPIELPGRGKRINEPFLNTFEEAAQDAYVQVVSKITSSKIVIYGHSMGASLALRVTSMLETRYNIEVCLIVSGSRGPCLSDKPFKHLLNNKDLILELIKLGGLPDEFVRNEDLQNFYLPILRSDFRLIELSDPCHFMSVRAPIKVIMGDKENEVDKILDWQRFSSSKIHCDILEGDHFFIYKEAKGIAKIINDWYDKFKYLQY